MLLPWSKSERLSGRGNHPPPQPKEIQNGGRSGGGGECFSEPHWLGTWRQHFDDDQIIGNHSGYAFLAESIFSMSLFYDWCDYTE
jgi:hypothetical protein